MLVGPLRLATALIYYKAVKSCAFVRRSIVKESEISCQNVIEKPGFTVSAKCRFFGISISNPKNRFCTRWPVLPAGMYSLLCNRTAYSIRSTCMTKLPNKNLT